jgi:hypothetical protein
LKITKVQLSSKRKIIKASLARTKNAILKTVNKDNGEQTKGKKVEGKAGAVSV